MKKLQKIKNRKGRNSFSVSMLTLMLFGAYSRVTFAAGEGGFDSATSALDTLKTGFFAIIAGIGVIMIGKNIMEISTAFQQQDITSLNNGIKGLVAGILMAGVGGIVSAMGF